MRSKAQSNRRFDRVVILCACPLKGKQAAHTALPAFPCPLYALVLFCYPFKGHPHRITSSLYKKRANNYIKSKIWLSLYQIEDLLRRDKSSMLLKVSVLTSLFSMRVSDNKRVPTHTRDKGRDNNCIKSKIWLTLSRDTRIDWTSLKSSIWYPLRPFSA